MEQIAEFPRSRTFFFWHRGSDGPKYRSNGIRIIVDLKPDHGIASKRYDASFGSRQQWVLNAVFHGYPQRRSSICLLSKQIHTCSTKQMCYYILFISNTAAHSLASNLHRAPLLRPDPLLHQTAFYIENSTFPIANQTIPSETIPPKDRHPINIHHRSHFKLDFNSPLASTTHVFSSSTPPSLKPILFLKFHLPSTAHYTPTMAFYPCQKQKSSSPFPLLSRSSLKNTNASQNQGVAIASKSQCGPERLQGSPSKHCTDDGITPSDCPETRLSMLSRHVEVSRFLFYPYLAAIQLRP